LQTDYVGIAGPLRVVWGLPSAEIVPEGKAAMSFDLASDPPSSPPGPEFRTGLPAASVHEALRSALAHWQFAEGCSVLWFAEVHRRALFRHFGYSSIRQYASEALVFSKSRTNQFLRLSEALERLPQLRQALGAGEIGWTKARVVARVATPGNEGRWLELARSISRSELEAKAFAVRGRARRIREERRRLVAAAGIKQAELIASPAASETPAGAAPASAAPAGAAPAGAVPTGAAPTDTRSLPPADAITVADEDALAADLPVGLMIRFSPEKYARYEALMEKLRKLASRAPQALPRGLTREDLILTGLGALLEQVTAAARDPRAGADTRVSMSSPYQIVIYKCETCARAEVRTTLGSLRIGRAVLEAVSCDARIVTAQGARGRPSIPAALRQAVLTRDGHRCQSPGCGRARFLELHHRVPASQGGGDDAANLVTLCSACHQLAHEKTLAGRLLMRRLRE
jgi:5-methylcytosine-specific restriction endonuclease McrA